MWLIVRTIVRLAVVDADDRDLLSAGYFQWDLSAYYYGPQAFRLAANPYDRAILTALAGVPSAAYVYPPLTLFVFWPLTALPFSVAYYGWLSLKVVAVAGLATLWVRRFVGVSGLSTLVYLAGFAFQSALIRDLNAGNISTLEQLGLWLAISRLGMGHLGAFALLIIMVAQFKLTPVLFLLLLACRPRPRWPRLALYAGAAAAVFSLNMAVSAPLTVEFLQDAAARDERGALNPSSLALIRDVLEWVGAAQAPSSLGVDLALLLGVAVLVWGLTGRALLRLRRSPPEEWDYLGAASLFCFAYALTVPRFKDYSYILLLIPTWRLLTHGSRRWIVAVAWAAVLASSNYVADVLGLSHGYASLMTATVLWALALVDTAAGTVERAREDADAVGPCRGR